MYVQTLIDDFNDGSINSAKWTIVQGPGPTESGGTLNVPCTGAYPKVHGKNFFDLSTGILASKLTVSGTRAAATEFYIGAHDNAGNGIAAMGGPNGTFLTFQASGNTTFSNEVKTDTTVGLGSGWVNGTWWGVGNLGSDNILRMYKSTDGLNWTEMARCTVGGTFNKANSAMMVMAGIWNGQTSSLVANFDDASFWADEAETFVTRKVRWGNTWIPATPKVRVDGAWVPAAPKPRIGDIWDPMT